MATIGSLLVNLILNSANFLRQLNQASAATARASRQMQTNMAGMSASFAAAGRGMAAFASAAAVALVVDKVVDYADAWKTASNQIAAADTLTKVSARSLASLNEVAAETRTSLQETSELYARLLRSTANLAVSEEDVARATEIANKAFKAGGASVQETVNGIRQLGQSLSSGIFQGDELRSIRENAPLLAKAIADEFNTTIGGLKKLGAEGKLTADRVFRAILAGGKPIEDAFAATNATIGESFTVLGNSLTQYIGLQDKASGASKAFTKTILDMAKSLREARPEAGGTSTFQNVLSDLATIDALVKKQAAPLREAFKDFFDFLKGPEIPETTFDKTIAWLADKSWSLFPDLVEAARKKLEEFTGSVETFYASQGRTGLGRAIDMAALGGAPRGGRGFVMPGPTKEQTTELREWRQELELSIRDHARLREAATQGQEALDQMNDRIEAENKLLAEGQPLRSEAAQAYIAAAVAAGAAERALDTFNDELKATTDLTRELSQQEELQTALRTSTAAFEEAQIKIEALNRVLAMGVDVTVPFGQGLVKMSEDIVRAEKVTEQLTEKMAELPQMINSTFNSAISSVSSAFADAVVEGEKFRDMLDALLKDLAKLAINSVMNLFLRQILGNVAVPGGAQGTGLLGGLGFHGGGIVGSGEGSRRNIPASVVAGAPRFHAGLMSNEFAAVLKKGEGVFTPEQMKSLGGGTINNFTVINQAPNTKVTEERRENSSGGMDITATIREMMTKEVNDPASSVHRSMRSNFGLQQAGIRR